MESVLAYCPACKLRFPSGLQYELPEARKAIIYGGPMPESKACPRCGSKAIPFAANKAFVTDVLFEVGVSEAGRQELEELTQTITEGLRTEDPEELVDRLRDDPRLARFRHLSPERTKAGWHFWPYWWRWYPSAAILKSSWPAMLLPKGSYGRS
jgi:hypothetical protein